MLALNPLDFEEMAAEQNRSPLTQHLLGGISLKLAFCQTGAQRSPKNSIWSGGGGGRGQSAAPFWDLAHVLTRPLVCSLIRSYQSMHQAVTCFPYGSTAATYCWIYHPKGSLRGAADASHSAPWRHLLSGVTGGGGRAGGL
jgi:hypothetical protein